MISVLGRWTLAATLSLVLLAPTARAAELPANLAGDPEAAGFADLFFTQALLKLSGGDVAGALTLVERAAATVPDDATYAYFRGVCLTRLSRTDEAIEAFRKALPPAKCSVPEATVRLDLGSALLTKGDLANAETELAKAVELAPDNGRTRFTHGLALLRAEKYDEGLKEIDRATGLDASLEPEGSFYKGIAAYRAGNLDEAKEHFNRAQALNTESGVNAAAWLNALQEASKFSQPPAWEARVSLGFDWDNNPAQLTNDLIAIEQFLGDDVKDTRTTAQVRGSWLPVRDRGGYTLQITGLGYTNRHADFDRLDADGWGAFVGLARGVNPLGFLNGPLGYVRVPARDGGFGWLLQAGTNRFNLDGEKLRSDVAGDLSLFLNAASIGVTQLDLQYEDRTFEPAEIKGVSGDVMTARLSQQIWLGTNPSRFIRASIAWADHNPDDSGLKRTERQVAAEMAWPMGKRWTLFVYGARTRTHFDDFEGVERIDRRFELKGSVAFAITRWMYLSARYGTTEFTVEPSVLGANLDFDRKVGSFNVNFYW